MHRALIGLCSGFLLFSMIRPAAAQQQDTFHWIDFHSEKDQPVITWVTRTLDPEKWTAIRDIGVLYDAALVVTTRRAAPDASPATDTFDIWSVSLTKHLATPLLKGVNLRWLDWMQFTVAGPREIAALYDDCRDCAATTYFTAFHFDYTQHLFVPRWMRGGQTIPVWSNTAPEGVKLSQIYAVLTEPDGRQAIATWNHYDYGTQKPAEDYVYRYDLDSFSGLERTQLVSNKEGEVMKQRLCSVQGLPVNLARGQDSALCQPLVHARPERKVPTGPPPNNQGRSVPPGSHH